MATSSVAKISPNASAVSLIPLTGSVATDVSWGDPLPQHRRAGGFSGRPFCRIYPEGDEWILEAVRGGWGSLGPPSRKLRFPALTAAIAYAVTRGFSYRVVHAPPGSPGRREFARRRPHDVAREKIGRVLTVVPRS
jgi:hypothetical protein